MVGGGKKCMGMLPGLVMLDLGIYDNLIWPNLRKCIVVNFSVGLFNLNGFKEGIKVYKFCLKVILFF